MAEADCLAYCRARGFDWGGLYDLFRRVSCWCCPLQPLSELRILRKHFPELWEKLRYMDAHTWRQFRADYSVEQLEQRFALEEERAVQGLPLKGGPFMLPSKTGWGKMPEKRGEAHEAANAMVDVVTAPAHRLVACSNNSRGVAAGDGLDEADGEVEHRAGAAEGYSLD